MKSQHRIMTSGFVSTKLNRVSKCKQSGADYSLWGPYPVGSVSDVKGQTLNYLIISGNQYSVIIVSHLSDS